ncbi:tetratricopeptide repeat protein [Winogradskyella sp.]
MKNAFTKITFLFFFLMAFMAQAQEEKKKKEEIMATIICECLENENPKKLSKNFDDKFNDCYTASVLGALISGVPTDKDSTITINSDGSSDQITEKDKKKALKILEKECEVYKNQINKGNEYQKYLVNSTKESCECINEISTSISLDEKNQLISECITQSVSASNARKYLDLDTVENIKAFYNDIQRQLVNECEALKKITFSNDEEKLYSYSSNDKASDFYNKGLAASEKGNYEKALKFYKKAVEIDDKFVFAWDNLGRTYRELHDYDKAIEAYKNSIAIDSLNRTPLMNIAVAYNYKNDFESGEYWYNKLIDAYPKDPEGYYGLSLTYMRNNKLEASLNSVIDAYILYKESKSPYTADAEKVMQYLLTLFKEQDKVDSFKKICKDRDIELNID